MAGKTTPENPPVTIDNPEQASTNFYWTYLTEAGMFNLQTTIRGILSFDQIKAHIAAALEATAHVTQLGGIAKQVGNKPDVPAEKLPEPSASEIIPLTQPSEDLPPEPQYVPVQEPAKPTEYSFETEFLECTITNNKQFFKILGGMFSKYGVTVWPEVLTTAGIQPTKLEGGKKYNLHGYNAFYVLNDKGKPQKVVRLEKVA